MVKMKTNYILLSHKYDNDTPTYGNRDKFEINNISKISEGHSANSSSWNLSTNHIGTHIDLPKHFYDEGTSLSDFDISEFFFHKAQMVEVKCDKAHLIEYSDIESKIDKNTDLLLIKTGYEQHRGAEKYWNDNPGLSSNLGMILREKFICLRAIGFDFISLTSWKFRDEGKKAHLQFLKKTDNFDKFIIIEDMSLKHINHSNKIQKVIVSPLFVNGANGTPATVFCQLMEET